MDGLVSSTGCGSPLPTREGRRYEGLPLADVCFRGAVPQGISMPSRRGRLARLGRTTATAVSSFRTEHALRRRLTGISSCIGLTAQAGIRAGRRFTAAISPAGSALPPWRIRRGVFCPISGFAVSDKDETLPKIATGRVAAISGPTGRTLCEAVFVAVVFNIGRMLGRGCPKVITMYPIVSSVATVWGKKCL